jgi:hemerythrin-like domain-containing protein
VASGRCSSPSGGTVVIAQMSSLNSVIPERGLRGQSVNIFEALRESHDRQRTYADALIQTSGDTPERVEAYKQLKSELQAHETAEERHFYIPLMEFDNGVDLSRHAISEHHEMDEMMEELDETEMSSPAWLATAKKLAEKVNHHLEEEEQKFFQMAGKLLDDKQKETLAGQYEKEYKAQLS